MVKRDIKTSIFENDRGAGFNENGKRPSEDQSKDGKKRIKSKSLYRQPTVNEINRLQETENLFNSNLFRLQIEEILQEIKLKEKTEKKFQQWFVQFKSHLESTPEDDTEYDLTEQTLYKKLKVKLPVSSELKKTKCVFRFHKFKDVEIVGSYILGCSINSKLRVDVQITVPADTYTKNDSINYRYHKKRAAYLTHIASHLSKLDTVDELKYTWLNGCETKPVLDLKPAGKLGNHLSVRINLICELDAYKLHRFSPARNNLREAWLLSMDNNENTEIGPPTPYYNSSILNDLTASINQKFLKETFARSENLKQAVILLKIWLRQRNLQVSGHVVSLIVAYFVQTKRINNIMSSYQIVRNVWIALKTSEWGTKGICLQKGESTTPSLEEFHQHFPVVFIDKTGFYNICWQMCKGTYNALRRESALAVEMLDNGKINSFIPLFMTPVKPLMQFDHILRVKNIPNLKESVLNKASTEAKLNYGLDQLALVTDSIHSLLVKGLGSRVDLILQLHEADFSWPVKKSPEKVKKEGYEEKLSFGFILNPENAINIVEKGPPANLPEAEEFRAFWGDKSELRRFQDGSITETCVWEGDTMAERRGITKQIVDYLMNFKYNISASELFHACDQLEGVLRRGHEEASLHALRAFDDLRRDLRQLTGLPLDISAVYGVSPVFSYSAPLPPVVARGPAQGPARGPARKPWRRGSAALLKEIPRPDGTLLLPEYVPVCKAVVELGHSGKWPGDIEAFRCLKAAFNVQIAERLTSQYSESAPAHAAAAHVDVLREGLVFRLALAHPKEAALLRRVAEGGVVKYRDTEESVNLHCDTVLLPRLRGALHGLHQKYPAFGATACLFKRWVSGHLLSPPHFPEAAAELVAAAAFLRCEPARAPALPTVGLLRVLRLLADTDWTRELLVLDFNDDMSREEISALEQKSTSDSDPGPCLRIVTAYGAVTPTATPRVVARAQALAASAVKYMEEALLNDLKDNILGAFVPSLSGYDVLIHLHPALVPHVGERVGVAGGRPPAPRPPPAPEHLTGDVIPVVEFNPVLKYLDELRGAYDEFALFFHDLYGGDVIAVLWKPDLHDIKDFQVSNANALSPVMAVTAATAVTAAGGTKYRVNTEALVNDFRLLGDGLVRDITVTSL